MGCVLSKESSFAKWNRGRARTTAKVESLFLLINSTRKFKDFQCRSVDWLILMATNEIELKKAKATAGGRKRENGAFTVAWVSAGT